MCANWGRGRAAPLSAHLPPERASAHRPADRALRALLPRVLQDLRGVRLVPGGRRGLSQVCTPAVPTHLGPSSFAPFSSLTGVGVCGGRREGGTAQRGRLGDGGKGRLNTPSLCLLSQFLGKMAPNFTILIKNSIHYPKFQFSK